MLKALFSAVGAARVTLFEVAGAAAVVTGLAMWSPAAGWVGGGVALLAKSLALDIERTRREGDQ